VRANFAITKSQTDIIMVQHGAAAAFLADNFELEIRTASGFIID